MESKEDSLRNRARQDQVEQVAKQALKQLAQQVKVEQILFMSSQIKRGH